MNRNEQYYRQTMGAIGVSMLFFFLFINVFSIAALLLRESLLLFTTNYVLIEVIYQIVYGCGYMLSFMIPVAIMKARIQKKGYIYHSMQAPAKVSPWLLLMVPALVTISFSASYVNSYFVNLFDFLQFSSGDLSGLTKESPFQIVLQFIVICVVPGFCEEFLFRGAILTNCLPFGRSNAILISAFLFAMMHQNPAQIFYTFVAGILLGLIYERTGSIWNTTVLHILNNFISTTEGLIPTRFASLFTSSVALALFETGLFMLGMICIAILILKFFSKKNSFEEGVFGAENVDVNVNPAHPIERGRLVRLFLTPSMVIFLVLSLIMMIAVMFVLPLIAALVA